MTGTGRPLRFLLGLVGLWIGVRAIYLWPEQVAVPVLAAAVAPPAEAAIAAPFPRSRAAPPVACPPRCRAAARPAHVPTGHARAPSEAAAVAQPVALAMPASARAMAPPAEPGAALPLPGAIIAAPLPPADRPPSRFAVSAWLIARGGSATPLVPQLGGSQAGMRATVALDAARRLALAARVSGALDAREREAAIGVDWRPTSLPIHLVAEQRIGLAGMRSGPAIGVVGGIGPTPVAGRLELDAYAQAGAIARRGGFIDGAVRLAHPIATHGRARLLLGAGAWGAAQREASRVDVGPALTLAAPLSGKLVRLELDWRQRIVGDAAPASGPALSIGTDF